MQSELDNLLGKIQSKDGVDAVVIIGSGGISALTPHSDIDLGDPNRFTTFGEFVAEIYQTMWRYNHTRIHSALRMPPAVFAEQLVA